MQKYRFLIKIFKKTNDSQARGGAGAAGHSKSIDFLLKSLRKLTIFRLGAVRERPGIAKVSIFNSNLFRKPTMLTKKSEKAPTCPYFYEEKNTENRSDEATSASHRTIDN